MSALFIVLCFLHLSRAGEFGSARIMPFGKPQGIRQRLGISDPPPPAPHVPMTQKLCEDYARGKFHASEVGQLAAASAASSSDAAPDISLLARAACKPGPHPSKSSARSLKRSLAALSDTENLQPYYASIPMWDSERGCQVMEDCSCLAPHEALSYVIPEGAEHDWASIDTDSIGLQNDLRNWERRTNVAASDLPTISLGLWGDTAPLGNRNNLCLLSCKVLSGTRKARLWIFAGATRKFCQCGCKNRCTYEAIWKILQWSFAALLAGVWPSTNHLGERWNPKSSDNRVRYAGTPLRFKGACLAKCGDWAWFKQCLNLQSWTAARPDDRLCWLCRCTKAELSDESLTAAWRSTRCTTTDLHTVDRHGDAQFISGLFSIPGMVLQSVFRI